METSQVVAERRLVELTFFHAGGKVMRSTDQHFCDAWTIQFLWHYGWTHSASPNAAGKRGKYEGSRQRKQKLDKFKHNPTNMKK